MKKAAATMPSIITTTIIIERREDKRKEKIEKTLTEKQEKGDVLSECYRLFLPHVPGVNNVLYIDIHTVFMGLCSFSQSEFHLFILLSEEYVCKYSETILYFVRGL